VFQWEEDESESIIIIVVDDEIGKRVSYLIWNSNQPQWMNSEYWCDTVETVLCCVDETKVDDEWGAALFILLPN